MGMADIQFDEEPQYEQSSYATTQLPKSFFTRLVLATRLVSTDEQAQYVLIGVTIGATLLAIFLFVHTSQPTSRTFSPEEIEQLQQMSQQK